MPPPKDLAHERLILALKSHAQRREMDHVRRVNAEQQIAKYAFGHQGVPPPSFPDQASALPLMTVDERKPAQPLAVVRCTACGAGGDLLSVGAVWHEGAIARCRHRDDPPNPNLALCPSMMQAIGDARGAAG